MLNANRVGPSEPVQYGDRRTGLNGRRHAAQAGHPEEEGLLRTEHGANRIAVVVPTDVRNLAWRAFYGIWSVVGLARTSARIALAARGTHGGTVAIVAGAGAVFAPVASLGLAAVESVLAAASFVATLIEKRRAGQALRTAERKQLDAIGALTRHLRSRRENQARHRQVSRPRLAAAAEDIVPDEAAADAPGEPQPSAAPDMPEVETDVLRRAARDAVLERALAAARHREGESAVLDAGLTLMRDTVVQSALVGSATAQTLKELAFDVAVGLKQATLSSTILGVAMGAAHIATGAVQLWRAVKNLFRQKGAIAALSAAKRRLLGGSDDALSARERRHKQRIAANIGGGVLDAYTRTRQAHRASAIRTAIWSALRIIYGSSSASVGIASIVLLAGAASGGAAIPIVLAALSTAWLLFAGYKLITGRRAQAREQREAAGFAEAMKRMTGHADVARALQDCTLHDLHALPSLHRELDLDSNKYYRAALLARYLHIESETGKNTDVGLKEARVQASAALQLIGVPRELTHLLKRSSMEARYAWILGFLNGHDNRGLLETDPAVIAAVGATASVVVACDHDAGTDLVASSCVEPLA